VYQGDYGFPIEILCQDIYGEPLDLAEVHTAYLFIERGEEDVLRKPMVINYEEKKISYTVEQGVLSISGTYTFQPKLIFNGIPGEITGTPIKEKVETPISVRYEGE